MKKVFSVLTAAILCLALLLPMSVSAAGASASLTGPGTVRAGDTITLTFNLNGSGLFGASGTLSYDSSQVTLTGTKQSIAAPWAVEFNGNNFVAYDNNLSNPINKNKALFTATFTVKNVAVGTAIKIAYTNVTASDGSADANVGTVTYQKTVAAPLSGANKLTSLTVSNATISPAFSPDTVTYTASVPFSVSKLDVKAIGEAKTTVSISNPTLKPGGTTNVVISVKAENGATKAYTIKVTREKDPNYVASSEKSAKEIKVDGFVLSPAFSADITQYVVWLPYETTAITVTGQASDAKASVEVIGGTGLLAGQDNEVKVIITAEDGSKKTYTVIAKRAAAHDGSVDAVPDEPAEKPTDIEPQQVPTGGIAWCWLIVVGVIGIGAGVGIGFVVFKKK